MTVDRAKYEGMRFPLSLAVLCQDCNMISTAEKCCPGCASEALLPLAGVLNREEETVDAVL